MRSGTGDISAARELPFPVVGAVTYFSGSLESGRSEVQPPSSVTLIFHSVDPRARPGDAVPRCMARAPMAPESAPRPRTRRGRLVPTDSYRKTLLERRRGEYHSNE